MRSWCGNQDTNGVTNNKHTWEASFSKILCSRLACSLSFLVDHRETILPLTSSICESIFCIVSTVCCTSGLILALRAKPSTIWLLIRDPSLVSSSICKSSRVFLLTILCLWMLCFTSSMVSGTSLSVNGSMARARCLEMLIQSQRNGSTCCKELEHSYSQNIHHISTGRLNNNNKACIVHIIME